MWAISWRSKADWWLHQLPGPRPGGSWHSHLPHPGCWGAGAHPAPHSTTLNTLQADSWSWRFLLAHSRVRGSQNTAPTVCPALCLFLGVKCWIGLCQSPRDLAWPASSILCPQYVPSLLGPVQIELLASFNLLHYYLQKCWIRLFLCWFMRTATHWFLVDKCLPWSKGLAILTALSPVWTMLHTVLVFHKKSKLKPTTPSILTNAFKSVGVYWATSQIFPLLF